MIGVFYHKKKKNTTVIVIFPQKTLKSKTHTTERICIADLRVSLFA
jgi:hypothetical protein